MCSFFVLYLYIENTNTHTSINRIKYPPSLNHSLGARGPLKKILVRLNVFDLVFPVLWLYECILLPYRTTTNSSTSSSIVLLSLFHLSLSSRIYFKNVLAYNPYFVLYLVYIQGIYVYTCDERRFLMWI